MSLPFSSKSPALSNYEEDIKPLVSFLVAFTPPSPQMVGSVPPASDRASVWMAGSILPARSSRRRRSAQNSVCWAEKLRPMCAKARGHKTKTTQMTRTKTTDPVKRPGAQPPATATRVAGPAMQDNNTDDDDTPGVLSNSRAALVARRAAHPGGVGQDHRRHGGAEQPTSKRKTSSPLLKNVSPVSSGWASSTQPMPRGQTTWSTAAALSGLDGPSDTATSLSLFGCTASAVVTQKHTFTHTIFHSVADRCEAKLTMVFGPVTEHVS